MFSLRLRAIVLVSLLIIAGVTAANAQLSLGSSLKVSVPDSFIVNDKVMPAGDYTISALPTSRSILVLRGKNESVFFRTQVSDARDSSTATNIVLEKVNGSLYLSKINISGSPSIQVAKTKAQRDAIAKAGTSETVAILTGF